MSYFFYKCGHQKIRNYICSSKVGLVWLLLKFCIYTSVCSFKLFFNTSLVAVHLQWVKVFSGHDFLFQSLHTKALGFLDYIPQKSLSLISSQSSVNIQSEIALTLTLWEKKWFCRNGNNSPYTSQGREKLVHDYAVGPHQE